MTLVKSDSINGCTDAVNKTGLFNPGYSIQLRTEELKPGDTRITITGLQVRKRFSRKQVDAENSMIEILDNLSINF